MNFTADMEQNFFYRKTEGERHFVSDKCPVPETVLKYEDTLKKLKCVGREKEAQQHQTPSRCI
jgi:hypothetical protein